MCVCVCVTGNDGDDFLVLGLRNGRVVHRFNLGSGVAAIVSDRLNHRIDIHTVTFGRSKKTGWLKVIFLLVGSCCTCMHTYCVNI